eukprot:gene41634-50807_t
MGGAASVEGGKALALDYSTLKSARPIDFPTAYSAIETQLKKGKSELMGGPEVSLQFLAVRQLSQTLRNQDSLERSGRKVLKSRSMPDNLKYKNRNLSESIDVYAEEDEEALGLANEHGVANDLDPHDLALIADDEFAASNLGRMPGASSAHPHSPQVGG